MYIAFCGAQSVGKSTTCDAIIPLLSQLYDKPVYYIKEVARKLNANSGVLINSEGTSDTQRLIEEEYAREEEEHKDAICIADRTIIDRYAYTLLSEAAKDSKLLDWYENNLKSVCEKYSHIFYVPLTPELQLVPDGVRSTDEGFRRRIDFTQNSIIKTHNIPAYTITGTTEQRLKQIASVLNRRL